MLLLWLGMGKLRAAKKNQTGARLMSNLKTSIKLHIFIAIFTIIILYFINLLHGNISEFNNSWHRYINQVSSRQMLLQDVKSHFGYGGAIHNFKNYLIRNQEKYHVLADDQFKNILSSIEYYRAIPNLSEFEKEALNNVSGVTQNYQKQLKIVVAMHKQGASIKMIDQIVKVDDSPAIKAFNILQNEYDNLTAESSLAIKDWGKKSYKYTVILFLLVAVFSLSFGSVITKFIRAKES
jgi:methyl-accepting chemotaxis protein